MKIVAQGQRRSERRPAIHHDSTAIRRATADGPAPSVPTAPTQKKAPPQRSLAQVRKDAGNLRVVSESLGKSEFIAMLQRGAPDLIRVYMSTKAKSRGCSGCGMKSLYKMIHDELVGRQSQPALAEAMSFLRSNGWNN